MRTAILAVVLASLLAAPAAANDDPEPRHNALQQELSLPPFAQPEKGAKGKPQLLPLSVSELRTYGSRTKKDTDLCKAIRQAQVVLWASTTEPAPTKTLRADVAAFYKKSKFDPQALKTRFNIPDSAKAENALRFEVFEHSKQLTRLEAHLEEALEALDHLQDAAEREGPRWAAHVLLLRMWLLGRIVRLSEHQSALGALRKELPEYESGKHTAWQLVPQGDLFDSASKKVAKTAARLKMQLLQDHASTAWAALVRKQGEVDLGSRWEAVK